MLTLLIATILGSGPGTQSGTAAGAAAPAAAKLEIEPFGYRGVSLDDGPLRLPGRRRARRTTCGSPTTTCSRDFACGRASRRRGPTWAAGTPSDVFHVFGQILSGLARLHAATGDPACREKAEALLEGWAECIEPDGYFYYSRKPNAPHYIYDKMVGGLTDMVLYCDSKPAAESLAKITGWAIKNLDRSNAYAFGGTEWYTLSENLYRAHRATGDRTVSRLRRPSGTTTSTGTSTRGKGDLFGDRGNGRRTEVYHAYSHVNTLGGAAQAYLHSRATGVSSIP